MNKTLRWGERTPDVGGRKTVPRPERTGFLAKIFSSIAREEVGQREKSWSSEIRQKSGSDLRVWTLTIGDGESVDVFPETDKISFRLYRKP